MPRLEQLSFPGGWDSPPHRDETRDDIGTVSVSRGVGLGEWLRDHQVSFAELPKPGRNEGIFYCFEPSGVPGEPLENKGVAAIYFDLISGRPSREFFVYDERELETTPPCVMREISESRYREINYCRPLLQQEIRATEVQVRTWWANEGWRKVKRHSEGLVIFVVVFDPSWSLDISGRPQFFGGWKPNTLEIGRFEPGLPGAEWQETYREIFAGGNFISFGRRGDGIMRPVEFDHEDLLSHIEPIPEALRHLEVPSTLGPARMIKF